MATGKAVGKRGGGELLSTREACEHLGLGRSTLYRLARRKRLRVAKLGGRVLWPRDELDRMVRDSMRTVK